jgi:hypothetical protein
VSRRIERSIKNRRLFLMEIAKRNLLGIQFGRETSDKDIEELMEILECLAKKYHFRWFEDTYKTIKSKETPEEKE